MRLHIGLFGRRNVGKSSVLNALTRQAVSIVSDVAGTTTDPVEKPMELLPIGPVQFIDTAGVDDIGALGQQRIEKTQQIFARTDVGIIVAEAGHWNNFEDKLFDEMKRREIPTIVVFNKCDLNDPHPEIIARLKESKIHWLKATATQGEGMLDLREALIKTVPDEWINSPTILGDLVPPGDMAVLVVPIDLEAPKGRLILPQVQSIRDILDNETYCMVVKENALSSALNRLNKPPALVVTDSQAFAEVAADTPVEVPLTSFSILFARFKGDLEEFTRGTMAIDRLRSGDRVLIAEACTHHPIGDDIGRVKIPHWLNEYIGGELRFTHVQGHDFPENLDEYQLVIMCGSCMHNRREVLTHIMQCRETGVPVTNYGITIAFSLGIFERALSPFPEAMQVYREMQKTSDAAD
jgi:[FeFe] hydrogenase H-cluster maturation GTPase HydF